MVKGTILKSKVNEAEQEREKIIGKKENASQDFFGQASDLSTAAKSTEPMKKYTKQSRIGGKYSEDRIMPPQTNKFKSIKPSNA